MPNIIVGTAGHIDHGKTSLVKALTGIDADRLKEEKERGITIDIGFANLALDPATSLGFIDVPGHERFIKNMLAGVGGIDVVMLVIAADESVMPQTREHLAICSLLRIRQGLTVITKIDATDPELADLAEIEVHEFLKGSFLERAPVLRVSAQTGEGIPALVDALAALARSAPAKDAGRIFRLPIDRAFTMKGFGTVVAGTLIAGHVRRDDEVELLPQRQAARVRGVQVHGTPVDEAQAGQRTALNLQRVELGDVERGMVVAPPGIFLPTSVFDVHLELLASAPGPVVRRKRIRFHTGTAELIGYVVLLGQDTLLPGESAFAQVLLERPTFALPGDRFIVRQYSPMATIGGGEILDARPRRHRRSDQAIVGRLEMFRQGSLEEQLASWIGEAGVRTADLSGLVGRLGIPQEAVRLALQSLSGAGRIRVLIDQPMIVVDAATFTSGLTAILEEVRRFHAAEPLVKGIGREELRGRVLRGASPALFRALLEHLLETRQLAVDQDVVHAFERQVTLGGEDARIRGLLADRFQSLGLQAPSADEVIAGLGVERETARKIVQLMVEEQALVRISADTIIDRKALQKLIDDVKALKPASPRFGVREFKDLTGLSRKFALPLLEYLDGQRVTRRLGDERIIL
jgi:selenocysteine-specific elongation factor